MRILFKLDSYFNTYKYMRYFYDAKIKKLNITKKVFLRKLNISYTSYNRSSLLDSPVNKVIFTRLESYFNINPLNNDKLPLYNRILTDVIIKIYYKQNGKDGLLEQINAAINDNNYLSPVFELLLYLYKLSNIDLLQKLHNEYRKAYNYLSLYEKLFSIYPTKELYLYLSLLTCDKNLLSNIQLTDIADDFYGMIYNAISLNAFINERYDLALIYIKESYDALIKMCNYRRIIILNIVYYATLNLIGEHSKVKIEAEHQLIYLSDLDINMDIIEATKVQYYNSLLALRNFYDILDYYNSLDIKHSVDHIYYLIGLHFLDNNEFKRLYKELFKKINDKYTKDFIKIIDYLSVNSLENKEKLSSSNLNKCLKKTLLALI